MSAAQRSRGLLSTSASSSDVCRPYGIGTPFRLLGLASIVVSLTPLLSSGAVHDRVGREARHRLLKQDVRDARGTWVKHSSAQHPRRKAVCNEGTAPGGLRRNAE